MKKLSLFQEFLMEEFLKGKKLIVIACHEWKNFDTKEVYGSKVELVIIEDRTDYKLKEGEHITNLYEKFTVKISKEVNIPLNAQVRLVNPSGNIYGEFRNQISVHADDIEIVK